MTSPSTSPPASAPMCTVPRRPDRRGFLAGGLAALASAGLLPGPGLGQEGPNGGRHRVRVAALKFGSFNWLLAALTSNALDKKAGIVIETRDLALHQAGPIALLAGDADVIVTDWFWALRQRAEGVPVRFAPYSSALGALMVRKGAGIATLGDLAGKRLGVSGSALDKSWLLLRAYSRRKLGRDLAAVAAPVYGAAPLMAEELKGGRVDAALLFWTYAVRLPPGRFQVLASMDEVVRGLGAGPLPPFVGYAWIERAGTPPGIAAFLAAAAEANNILARSDAAWEPLRPLMHAKDAAEFAALKAAYRAGIPGPWGDPETRAAKKLMELLIETGGGELLGRGTSFDAEVFLKGPLTGGIPPAKPGNPLP